MSIIVPFSRFKMASGFEKMGYTDKFSWKAFYSCCCKYSGHLYKYSHLFGGSESIAYHWGKFKMNIWFS